MQEIAKTLEKYKVSSKIDSFASYVKDISVKLKHNGTSVEVNYEGIYRKEAEKYLRELLGKGIKEFSYRYV